MATVHGKTTSVVLSGLSGPASGSHDLSSFVNTSKWGFGSDTHDVTCYGATAHAFAYGLKVVSFTMGGVYDSSLPNAPWFVLQQANGQNGTLVLKPQGTGTGKESHSFTVLVKDYSQTAPVADMVTWEVTFEVSGDVTTTIQ